MPALAVSRHQPSTHDDGVIRSAVFSPDRRYRYHLSRAWSFGRGSLCFSMLNPSHADGADDDATIRKCIGFAKRLGVSRLTVSELLLEKRGLSAEIALRVAKLLNTTPESWLRMQTALDLWEASQKPEGLAKIKPIKQAVLAA